MSPMDQPENLLDMITKFVNNEPLHTRSGQVAEKLRRQSATADGPKLDLRSQLTTA